MVIEGIQLGTRNSLRMGIDVKKKTMWYGYEKSTLI